MGINWFEFYKEAYYKERDYTYAIETVYATNVAIATGVFTASGLLLFNFNFDGNLIVSIVFSLILGVSAVLSFWAVLKLVHTFHESSNERMPWMHNIAEWRTSIKKLDVGIDVKQAMEETQMEDLLVGIADSFGYYNDVRSASLAKTRYLLSLSFLLLLISSAFFFANYKLHEKSSSDTVKEASVKPT